MLLFAAKASPPGIPNLDKVGKNYVDLSWTKPRTDGGSPIKGLYCIVYAFDFSISLKLRARCS